MKQFRHTFCVLLVALTSCVFVASAKAEDMTFLNALKAFQDKNYPEAEKNYVTLLHENPTDPTLLTNLGLTYWEMQKKGLALAHFRHALLVNPSFGPAQSALNFSLTQLPIENPPHDNVPTEWIRENLLASISVWGLAFIHLFTFVGMFWCLISLARKSDDEKKSTATLLGLISIFGLLWMLSLALLVLKIVDGLKTRGTIVTAASAYALPDSKSVSLMELKEGVEVVIKDQQTEWVQVNFPGATTGWVPKGSVYIYQKSP